MNSRDTLLNVALTLFADRGFDAVGIQEIVEDAEVTKPSLYHFFGSKQGLLEALVKERIQPLEETLARAFDYRGDLPRTLADIVTAYLDFATRDAAFYRLFLSMSNAPPGSVSSHVAASALRWQREGLERVFVASVSQHGNLRDRHHRLSVALIGLIHGYIRLVWDGELAVTPQLAHEIVKLFSYGMYA